MNRQQMEHRARELHYSLRKYINEYPERAFLWGFVVGALLIMTLRVTLPLIVTVAVLLLVFWFLADSDPTAATETANNEPEVNSQTAAEPSNKSAQGFKLQTPSDSQEEGSLGNSSNGAYSNGLRQHPGRAIAETKKPAGRSKNRSRSSDTTYKPPKPKAQTTSLGAEAQVAQLGESIERAGNKKKSKGSTAKRDAKKTQQQNDSQAPRGRGKSQRNRKK